MIEKLHFRTVLRDIFGDTIEKNFKVTIGKYNPSQNF